MQHGHAAEDRFGFAATLANATPPVDRTFRRTLRAGLISEATRSLEIQGRAGTALDRRWGLDRWRLALGGGLAAVLALILAFVSLNSLWGPGTGQRTPTPDLGPQLDAQNVDALVQRLNQESSPRTVAVFPANYAPLLAERTHHAVLPLTPQAALPRDGLVDVVWVGHNGGDAARQVRVALEQQLYRIYRAPNGAVTETFGALERKQYVAGPESVSLQPVGVTFDNGIELLSAGVLDDPQPGQPLRLALDWRAQQPVDDPVTVFTHLLCDDRLVAQRDAIPGNGAFPVADWEPGQVVRDQFALQLPAELSADTSAGACQIQVGIYNAASGMRYHSLEPGGGSYVIIHQFTLGGASQTL
jgi:hypothetical protein